MDCHTFTSYINEFQQLNILWAVHFAVHFFFASFLLPLLISCYFRMSSLAKMIVIRWRIVVALICHSWYMATPDIQGKSRKNSLILPVSWNEALLKFVRNGKKNLALHYTIPLLRTVNGYSLVLESNMSTQFLPKLAWCGWWKAPSSWVPNQPQLLTTVYTQNKQTNNIGCLDV